MQPSKPILRLTPLDLPLALFLFSAILGQWPAYDRSLCWKTRAFLVAGFLLYVLISRLGTSHARWRAIATILVLACVLLSLYFVTQYDHFGYPETVGAISRLGAFIGKLVPSFAIWTPFDNGVATFLEGGLFLAVALTLTTERRAWRVAGAIGVGLIALALLMSTSRGAWLAVLVAATLWVALYWRPAGVAVVGGAILMVGLAIAVIVRQDITVLGDIPIVDRTLAPLFIRPDRLQVYRNSLYLIQDFPLTGIGLGGQFAMVLSKYALLIQVPFLTYSHNLYLEIWLQHGLLGAVAWLWLMAALYQAARTHAKPGPDLLVQSTWLGLTAVFVHGFTDARQYSDLWCWFPVFGLLGLDAAILLRRRQMVSLGRRWIFPAAVVGVFLVVVFFSLHPVPATWYANLGCVRQAQGDLHPSLSDGQRARLRQEAEMHYRRAIEIDPDDRTARQRLGLMMVDNDRFEEGVEHLQRAWQASPENTTTRKALGLAYVWVGDLERARPLLQTIPDIVDELNVWGWWRSAEKHQIPQGINAYRMSLLLRPDQPPVQERIDQLKIESAP
jgi:putative inorganic carbon (HCO3(-)) transporter